MNREIHILLREGVAVKSPCAILDHLVNSPVKAGIDPLIKPIGRHNGDRVNTSSCCYRTADDTRARIDG